jgi:Fur family ferric uptake transcriptional regulator
MNANLCDIHKIKGTFTQYLSEKSLRKTTERFEILEHICQIKGHFEVEMLRQRLEEHNFHVSRASIYNTIELLMDADLVVRHQFSTQLSQYELKAIASTHHHVICRYCWAIKEIKSDKILKGIDSLKITKFKYEYHSLFIYGMCSKCKFRLNNQKKGK